MKNSQGFKSNFACLPFISNLLIISSKREIEIFSYNFITLVTIAYLTFSHVCLCFKLRFFPLHPSSSSYSVISMLFFIQAVWELSLEFSQFSSHECTFAGMSREGKKMLHARGRGITQSRDFKWGKGTSRNHFKHFSNFKFQFKGKLVNDNTKIGKTSARFSTFKKA